MAGLLKEWRKQVGKECRSLKRMPAPKVIYADVKKAGKLEVYKDKKKEWRWRVIASNGRIIADSAEGYKRKGTMLKSVEKLRIILNLDEVEKIRTALDSH